MSIKRAGTIGTLALALMAAPAVVEAQGSESEAVMIAAGEWARGQLPGGALRLDPHRTGRSTDRAVAARVASALGAAEGTLEETRRCGDPTDPSSCRLEAAALLAIGAPSISGDAARVRVYAWYSQNDASAPVGKTSWDLTLRRTGSGWAVDGQRRLE